ncbi:MAG: phosphoribosylglycinamide formyltransferase [Gammaproteobacteria bacterium]|nr:phosphoribosylglycinamide formyltransferase [Gammaproteobacteria bacterium]
MTCRVVILISGSGTNLQALIDAAPKSGFNIEMVVSNKPGVFGLERAKKHKIPSKVIEHPSFGSREEFDRALSSTIDKINPDLIVLAGFMRILGAEFVRRFKNRILNIHPSLLPKYPGTNTHQRALDAGDKKHGATVHFVTEDLDCGPIIAQDSILINPSDTAKTLAVKILEKEHILYPQVVSWFASGRLKLENDKVLLDQRVLSPNGSTTN